MTMRGFLACYLGAVAIAGITGASAYHELQRRHAATQIASAAALPVAVAEVPPPETAAPAIPTTAAAEPKAVAPAPAKPVASQSKVAARWPRLRPHVVARAKPRPRVTTDRAEYLPPQPPPPSPPPMAYGYAYPAPAYPAYGGYYPYYYVRYGYYRSF